MNTAVILAARKERDSLIPYPLVQYTEGECLLDRTLRILKEMNIGKVIIIVGYRAELFQKYSNENDVIIVENKDYEFTASMGSLALAKNLIHDDFLLIESDTFFERTLLEKLTSIESGNCLTMTEESGSGDECFVETRSNFVTKITKDRHRVCNFEGEMIGVSRICLSTYMKLVDEWEQCSNPYLNYEYLLMDVTDVLDRPVLKMRNLIWGDVDCKEDFRRLKNDIFPKLRRKEDPFDHDNLLMHLATIFPDKDVAKAEIIKIGGMSNKNFRINLDGDS